jgi:hypothetical protein
VRRVQRRQERGALAHGEAQHLRSGAYATRR